MTRKRQLCLFDEDEPCVALTAAQSLDLAMLVEALLREIATSLTSGGISLARSAATSADGEARWACLGVDHLNEFSTKSANSGSSRPRPNPAFP
jgi:hypothetical protein